MGTIQIIGTVMTIIGFGMFITFFYLMYKEDEREISKKNHII